MSARPITIAVPKGRVLKALGPLLSRVGVPQSALAEGDDRRLIRELPALGWRLLLLKPDDVPTWVEYGAADLGVCGRDVLVERGFDLYQPVDLGIGRCQMVVATKATAPQQLPDPPRIATKYPRIAGAHFAKKGVQAEVVYVQGSVELAPLTGLADAIVDLVETGETLRQNALEVREVVAEISSVLVANRAAYKLLGERAREVVRAFTPNGN